MSCLPSAGVVAPEFAGELLDATEGTGFDVRPDSEDGASAEPQRLCAADSTTRSFWARRTEGRAWQFYGLYCNLDVNAVGCDPDDALRFLLPPIKGMDFGTLIICGGFRPEPEPGRIGQFRAGLRKLECAIQSGQLRTKAVDRACQPLQRVVGVSAFVECARAFSLPRVGPWPPRGISGSRSETCYVELPVVSELMELTLEVYQHFKPRYKAPWHKAPTEIEVRSYLTEKYGPKQGRLATQVTRNLKAPELRPGPRLTDEDVS